VEQVPDKEGDKAAKPRNRDTKPADKGEPGSVYVTSAQRLTAVIQRLRNSPPVFAIVDLPPVTEAGLTRRVGRLLDGVLLVVAAEEIDRHVAEHSRDWLLQSNVKIIGSILNKRRKYVPDWLYSTC
jgi:Mrp family chromosome partitioning ATPase